MSDQTIRIVAAVVDTKKLTLYKQDGSTIAIPQGDSRIQRILDEATPLLVSQGYADIYMEEKPVENPYKAFQETSGIVRFFQVAKNKLKKVFSGDQVGPTVVGTLPTMDSPKELLKTMEELTSEVMLEAALGATPVSSPEFDEKQVHEQQPIVKRGSTSKMGQERPDTVIAVVDGKIIPNMEMIRSQFSNAVNTSSITGLENFLKRIASVIDQRKHSIEDLLRFMERGDLPIADDGSILIYKVLSYMDGYTDRYVDCYTGKVEQWVGAYVCMDPELVDSNRSVDCSNGLHVARRGYIRSFAGDVCVLAKVAPEDVIAVPTYDPNKMRVCGYHIIEELPRKLFHLLRDNKPITEDNMGKDLLGRAIAGHHVPVTHEVRITRQMGEGIIVKERKNTKSKVIPQSIDLAPVEALQDEPSKMELKVETVDPLKVAKQVVKMTRKEQAQALYKKFKAKPSMELAQELLDLKKSSKVSWDRLGLTANIGMEVTEYLEPELVFPEPPVEPSKAKPAKKVPTKPQRPLSLKERATHLYNTMDKGKTSVVAYDAARELDKLKKTSRKSWSYLGIGEEEQKKIQDILKKGS